MYVKCIPLFFFFNINIPYLNLFMLCLQYNTLFFSFVTEFIAKKILFSNYGMWSTVKSTCNMYVHKSWNIYHNDSISLQMDQ